MAKKINEMIEELKENETAFIPAGSYAAADPIKTAFSVIQQAIADGYQPTNGELDMFVDVMLTRTLSPDEVELVKEVARDQFVPVWLSLICHYRRSKEQGAAWQLLMDDGWDNLAQER
jgi:hypothetical protein